MRRLAAALRVHPGEEPVLHDGRSPGQRAAHLPRRLFTFRLLIAPAPGASDSASDSFLQANRGFPTLPRVLQTGDGPGGVGQYLTTIFQS